MMAGKLCPLNRMIVNLLEQRGELSVSQIVGVLGKEISATKATQVGKRKIEYMSTYKRNSNECTERALPNPKYDNEYYVEFGKREIVAQTVSYLSRNGKVRRVGKGRYAPLIVKLYQPNEAV